MNAEEAKELLSSMAMETVQTLRRRAADASAVMTDTPYASATRIFADRLRRAADIIEGHPDPGLAAAHAHIHHLRGALEKLGRAFDETGATGLAGYIAEIVATSRRALPDGT